MGGRDVRAERAGQFSESWDSDTERACLQAGSRKNEKEFSHYLWSIDGMTLYPRRTG
jgi:hypothetical protein